MAANEGGPQQEDGIISLFFFGGNPEWSSGFYFLTQVSSAASAVAAN